MILVLSGAGVGGLAVGLFLDVAVDRVRSPAVELVTAAVFVLVVVRFGWTWTVPAELCFVAGLVALAFCDLEDLILPKRIVYPTAGLVAGGLVLATVVQGSWGRLATATACAAVELTVFLAIHLASPRLLGFGDVRLAPVIGLALGWIGPGCAFVGFFLANVVAALVGLGLIVSRRGSRTTALPFGVFLATGAVLALGLSTVIPVSA